MGWYLRPVMIITVVLLAFPFAHAQGDGSTDPLVRVLVTKGILTNEEARSLTAGSTSAEQRDRLAILLRDKGVISAEEFETLRAIAPPPNPATINAIYKPAPEPLPPTPQPSPPKVIAAVAPVRLLGIDAPGRVEARDRVERPLTMWRLR